MNHGFAVERDIAASGRGGNPCLAVRRLERGDRAEGQAGVLRAAPPGGFARSAGQPLPVQALRRLHGEGEALMSFAELDHLCRRLEALDHAQAMLGVDEAVNMPEGGGEKRAEAMSVLASMAHEMATAPQIADWIAAAEEEDLDAAQKAAVAEFKRSLHQPHLPLLRLRGAAGQCADALRAAVAHASRQERLERLPAHLREHRVAGARGSGAARRGAEACRPMTRWWSNMTPAAARPRSRRVFTDLKAFLKGFIPEALEAQARRRATHPLKALRGSLPHREAEGAGPRADEGGGLRLPPRAARRVAPSVLRRRALRRAHDDALPDG